MSDSNNIKLGRDLLTEGKFDQAKEVCVSIIENDPSLSDAYLGKLLAELEFSSEDMLRSSSTDISENDDFVKALVFADEERKKELEEISESIKEKRKLLSTYDSDFLEKMASKFCDNKTKSLLSLDMAILRRVIKNMYSSSGAKGDLSYTHISDIISLISTGAAHSRISLPGGVCAAIENDALIFTKDIKKDIPKGYKIKLSLGENIIDEDNSLIFICEEKDEKNEYTFKTWKEPGIIYDEWGNSHLGIVEKTGFEGDGA